MKSDISKLPMARCHDVYLNNCVMDIGLPDAHMVLDHITIIKEKYGTKRDMDRFISFFFFGKVNEKYCVLKLEPIDLDSFLYTINKCIEEKTSTVPFIKSVDSNRTILYKLYINEESKEKLKAAANFLWFKRPIKESEKK